MPPRQPKQPFLVLALACTLAGCNEKPPVPPKIEQVENYGVTALVLSTKNYDEYWAPMDAVLGWGPARNPEFTKGVVMSQSDRKYFYYPPPGRMEGISLHTANTHFVANTPELRALIKTIKAGRVYFFQGSLVNVTFPNGAHMRSSLVRTDTGNGACEVFLVKKVTPLEK